MLLEATLIKAPHGGPADKGGKFVALNDAAIVRGGEARVLRMEVLVDDSHLTTYIADGVVIATPTGSTAYSFSAGGPILDPTARNLVVTPIAAYLASVRSVVVSPAHKVRVRIIDGPSGIVSIDGRDDYPDRARRSGRDPRAAAAHAFHRAQARTAVLGAAATKGGIAARVNARGRQNRLMLRELAVRDLALIERVRVAFEPGLTVITGETGAGKSLLIDALGLVMGARSPIRDWCGTAPRVRASKRCSTLTRRPNRSSAFARCPRRGAASRASTTRRSPRRAWRRSWGRCIEIHGQHEQQRLLSRAWQRDVLDAFGGHEAMRRTVAHHVRDMRANEAALRELTMDPAELERRLELAEHAADEIEAAAPREGEVEELRARLAVAGNAQRIVALLAETHDVLASDGRSARDNVAQAVRAATELARLDPEIGRTRGAARGHRGRARRHGRSSCRRQARGRRGCSDGSARCSSRASASSTA